MVNIIKYFTSTKYGYFCLKDRAKQTFGLAARDLKRLSDRRRHTIILLARNNFEHKHFIG